MGRPPINPLADLARAAQAHLKRAKTLGASLDERMKAKKEASDSFTLDEDFRRDFAAVTTAVQHAGKCLIAATEANKSHLGGLTEAQLEAQYNSELVKAATTLTDEQWDLMTAARFRNRQ